jgi:hypothetical protein
MSSSALSRVIDAIDIETYLVCPSAQEGHELARRLGRELNLGDVDVMFEEFDGYGIRVRLRAMIHRPAARYAWLAEDSGEGKIP